MSGCKGRCGRVAAIGPVLARRPAGGRCRWPLAVAEPLGAAVAGGRLRRNVKELGCPVGSACEVGLRVRSRQAPLSAGAGGRCYSCCCSGRPVVGSVGLVLKPVPAVWAFSPA